MEISTKNNQKLKITKSKIFIFLTKTNVFS